jgi:hypothetical protein
VITMTDDAHGTGKGKNGYSHPKKPEPRSNNSKTLRRDDYVIVFFALLGFVGSVVLYRTTSAPPIIIAFYLATGVAALVYRFLGGLEGSTFVWGALRLGGTLAALVGIALGVTRYLEGENTVIRAQGEYEWQWAGDNWLGHIYVDNDGSAKIYMSKWLQCGNEKKRVSLLNQTDKGTVEVVEHLTKLRVRFPVQFLKYDANCNVVGSYDPTVLAGDLNRTSAFAGVIQYQNKVGTSLGDMILVKGYTSGMH